MDTDSNHPGSIDTRQFILWSHPNRSRQLTASEARPPSNSRWSLIIPVHRIYKTKVYAALFQSPKNQLTDLAWQVYYSLLEPGSPELLSLEGNYIGQIGVDLTAANGLKIPTDIHRVVISTWIMMV